MATGKLQHNEILGTISTDKPQYQKFRIQPQNYSMNLQAMTRDKLQFLLPVVFTVGPDTNQRDGHQGADFVPGHPNPDFNTDVASEALKKYVMLLADNDVRMRFSLSLPDFQISSFLCAVPSLSAR